MIFALGIYHGHAINHQTLELYTFLLYIFFLEILRAAELYPEKVWNHVWSFDKHVVMNTLQSDGRTIRE